MDKDKFLAMVEKSAVEAQKRDDICARSTMYGLKMGFDFIPEVMVTASMSLAGGAGASSGSCGAYCSGLLALGIKFNPTMAEERSDISRRDDGHAIFIAYRDAFMKEFGTTLCPELQKQLFGRSYLFTDENQFNDFMAIPDHAEKCAIIVGWSARKAAEMILQAEDVK